MPGVTVTLSGSAGATAVTDAAGNYSFAGLPEGGDYTVTASRDGYTFSPPNYLFRDMNGNRNASFAAQPVSGGSASSTTSSGELPGMSFPVSSVVKGDRKGLNWEHDGGWRDATNNAFPDWVEVSFAGARKVDEGASSPCRTTTLRRQSRRRR